MDACQCYILRFWFLTAICNKITTALNRPCDCASFRESVEHHLIINISLLSNSSIFKLISHFDEDLMKINICWAPDIHSPATSGETLAHRYTFLLAVVVKNDYTSYDVLPGTSDHSGHVPLTSLINKAFLPWELSLARCFFFCFFVVFYTVCVNSRDGCVVKIKGDQRFLKYSNLPIWPNSYVTTLEQSPTPTPHSDVWCEHQVKLLLSICMISTWLDV